jgi:SAM-dependent methyltransferase
MLNEHGYDNIVDFFVLEMERWAGVPRRPVRAVSVGAGDCAHEIDVAKGLLARGMEDFSILCLDISEGALGRANEAIEAQGLAGRISTQSHDFNHGLPPGEFDVVIANQSLHHVVELERLFDSVRERLGDHGCFLISDTIGRNGHQRWPEARALVEQAWQWMPPSYRYNHPLQRQEDTFLDWDCSLEGFEGIRAQDILPLLLERFQPGVFLAWGNIIDVFIDRGFGHHFRRQSEWDLHFIDMVQAMDHDAITSGRISPTHMLARFQKTAPRCVHASGIAPHEALRRP